MLKLTSNVKLWFTWRIYILVGFRDSTILGSLTKSKHVVSIYFHRWTETILKGVTSQSGESCGTCNSRVKLEKCISYATNMVIIFFIIVIYIL